MQIEESDLIFFICMDNQDWNPVTITKKITNDNTPKTKSTLTNAQKALLNNDEIKAPKYVDRELSQQITQARVAKGMNRKQLAKALCVTEAVVADMETERAVHNGAMINKFKTYLGINKNTVK